MRILLRNPRRELELDGPLTVTALLQRLELNPESVLVIVGDELVTRDARLPHDAQVEIRPVVSGGSQAATAGSSLRERAAAVRVSRAAVSDRGGAEIRPVVSGGSR